MESKLLQISKLLLLSVSIVMLNNFQVSAQCTFSQLGLDIDGATNLEESGYTVSISADGKTVAIGAPKSSAGSSNAGQVRIFKYLSGAWTQLGASINGASNNDAAGTAVAISGDGLTVAIGSPDNSGGGTKKGHVRVYKYIAGSWIQQGSNINGESNNDYSGNAVSLSSDGLILAIGASKNSGNGSTSGHVRIFKLIGVVWTQQGADIDGEATGDESGTSVSLTPDGLSVAIGAPKNTGNGSASGHARVYKYATGTWTKQGDDIDGESSNDLSGTSVSISTDGKTVAIGAPTNIGGVVGSGAVDRGHVRVYNLISGTWTKQGADIDGEENNSYSGISVSLSGDGLTVAVGAYRNSGGGGTDRGHARIYKIAGGVWSQLVGDIDGEASGDYSGWSVSLASDSLSLAIGAYWNAGGGNKRGHVRVYNLKCPCNVNSPIPIVAGTHTSIFSDTSEGFVCYCDINGKLLLALDTTGTEALVPVNGVSLQIGVTKTTILSIPGGIITNLLGGVILNRRWNVAPTRQPTSSVKVRYFFTDAEYVALANSLLTIGTTIGAPQNLEVYKLVGHGFQDPNLPSVSGTILANGSISALNTWVYNTRGADYTADFLVSSFSGGGIGYGGGGTALPAELVDFRATMHADKTIHLNWITASENNNNRFEIERSYDGISFVNIGQQLGTNTQTLQNYLMIDQNYNTNETIVYYKLKQVDNNGNFTYSDVRKVNLGQTEKLTQLNVYPNPSNGSVNLAWNGNGSSPMEINIIDIQGKKVFNQTILSMDGYQSRNIDLSMLNAGIYFVQTTINGNYEQLKLVIK